MVRAWAMFFIIIFIFFAIVTLHPSTKSVLHAEVGKPKVLLFSAVDIHYLTDSIQKWGGEVGVNGFFLSYLANWWTPKEKLFEHINVLTDLNRKGTRYGIDRNFIKVALGYGKLPDWTDDAAWVAVLNNFANIAELIRRSGTRGIAIDTEPYEVSLFDSNADRFKTIERDLLKAKIYQRGREMMQVLSAGFPEIEVIILPEGALYWFNPDQGFHGKSYELWIDLFDGMASVKNKKGIVIAAERTYGVTGKNSVGEIYNLINNTMLKYVQNLAWWKQKCSIALGMWPLGKSYSDKSARYSVGQFKEQFLQATALSPKYVWIYGHGAAWWQLMPNEIAKYTANGGGIWRKEYQVLPVDPAILEYYAVVKRGGSEHP